MECGWTMMDGTHTGRSRRLGVLFSRMGVTACVERTQLQATLLAIDEINAAGGVLGRKLEPVIHDPEPTPIGSVRWRNACWPWTGSRWGLLYVLQPQSRVVAART
jgi:hypothetical protein